MKRRSFLGLLASAPAVIRGVLTGSWPEETVSLPSENVREVWPDECIEECERKGIGLASFNDFIQCTTQAYLREPGSVLDEAVKQTYMAEHLFGPR
jgi:hypothetical protein